MDSMIPHMHTTKRHRPPPGVVMVPAPRTRAQCSSTGQCSNTKEFRMFGLFYLLEKLNKQGFNVRAPINYVTLDEYTLKETSLTRTPSHWFGLCYWGSDSINNDHDDDAASDDDDAASDASLTTPPNFINLLDACINESPDDGYVIFPLYLRALAEYGSIGHENYVLINCKTKLMYRLEPNGYGEKFSKKYNSYFLDNDLNSEIALELENDITLERLVYDSGPHTSNPCGFCLTWAIWMVENFINSECNYEDMMNIAKITPTPTAYNNSVYQWGTELYTFLSGFLSHSQQFPAANTIIQINDEIRDGVRKNARKRSHQLNQLSNDELYGRFCYTIGLVRRMFDDSDIFSSRGINITNLNEKLVQFSEGVLARGIKKRKSKRKRRIRRKKQKTKRRRKKSRKHRKVRKSKKHKKHKKSKQKGKSK